jgi:hypothetical protein
MSLFCVCVVLCVASGLTTGLLLVQEVLLSVQKMITKLKKKKKAGPARVVEPLGGGEFYIMGLTSCCYACVYIFCNL